MTPFTDLIDLAARPLGGAVVAANDELFAEKENLIKPEPAVLLDGLGHKGGLYDGWETRRRRDRGGHDLAVVRLGLPGVVRGVVVDTAWFTGNHPASVAVDGAAVEGHPGAADLLADDVEWVELVPQTACKGDARNEFAVADEHRFTHVRLRIYPDGGVARLRVHGEVVPDPRYLRGLTLDLLGLESGGRLTDCSDRFYSSPEAMLVPGRPTGMDGWETRRRRDDGNDWAQFRLAGAGLVRQVEVDTTYNVGNAPGACRLLAIDRTTADPEDPAAWEELLPTTPLQPDTRHRFLIADPRPVTDVRFDVYPDGGVARLRLHGELTAHGAAALATGWFDRLPATAAAAALAEVGLGGPAAAALVAGRPYADPAALRSAVDRAEPGLDAGVAAGLRALLA